MNDEVGGGDATDVSLREYLTAVIDGVEQRSDARFEAMKDAVNAAFESSEKAILKAEAADKVRFESFNEFNQRIDTILANTATRDSVEALTDSQRQALQALSEKLESQINRNREDLDALAKRIDLRQGEIQGSKLTYTNLVALITTMGVVITVAIVLANYFSSR